MQISLLLQVYSFLTPLSIFEHSLYFCENSPTYMLSLLVVFISLQPLKLLGSPVFLSPLCVFLFFFVCYVLVTWVFPIWIKGKRNYLTLWCSTLRLHKPTL
ncbi:hypothetical protein V2J09_003854 [Rumex salicifolius]